jgi:hypothetical protein
VCSKYNIVSPSAGLVSIHVILYMYRISYLSIRIKSIRGVVPGLSLFTVDVALCGPSAGCGRCFYIPLILLQFCTRFASFCFVTSL